ncbi:uncharacterized protein LOC121737948 [Aricia agestis]|uniref:uncharacterized protein LOC121737948 n=1 Tax=Aricia agestis TaxID=91739 RepID=UPI001C207B60|nr:uncharacterized protein LOC121737948 [Aricia agestis]
MFHKLVFSVLYTIIFIQCLLETTECSQQNKTLHHTRKASLENNVFKRQKLAYRSFQPVAPKARKNFYPRIEERNDYDLNAYDTEYGGVVSNFTSSIYDDNPPLYPNPETISKHNKGSNNKQVEKKTQEPEVELPDDSLADADLKEHNMIDSITYLYGFNNCHGGRNEWMILIFIASGLSVICPVVTLLWLMYNKTASEFRSSSKIYPIITNLCCCLMTCATIYIQAIMGSSSPTRCERIALVLHYTHISCSMWIVALAAAVAEYSLYESVLPLKYNYLLAYGVPAVIVMFSYALSLEHYEIKNYCWMSIEKGMVMGFMIPAMILIVINTGIVIVGLQSVNRKHSEMLASKIQELVDHHVANWPKDQNENDENIEHNFSPSTSRKNTDSTDTLDKEYDEDDCQYPETSDGANDNNLKEINDYLKTLHDKGFLNMLYMDNLSFKWSWNTEGNQLKTYLNLCLVLEPFFAINWVMGVVAIENANHWSTPGIYLILVLSMHIYLAATVMTTLPIVQNKNTECCEDVVIEQSLPRSRTTDDIPLLDPTVQQPSVTLAPADTISTISI